MTTLQLRAELFKEINPLLESEVLLQKILTFVKDLVRNQPKADDKLIESTADDAKTAKQKAYVKETLLSALDEVERAKRGEIKLKTMDEFLAELDSEEEEVL